MTVEGKRDIVELLVAQHGEIKAMLERVRTAERGGRVVGPDSPIVADRLAEADEFPCLRERVSPDDLRRMARALRAAEAAAPTRPHPRVGEPAAVTLLAPRVRRCPGGHSRIIMY